jgi:hypothetical protein
MKKSLFILLIFLVPLVFSTSQEEIEYWQNSDCFASYHSPNSQGVILMQMNCYYNKAVITGNSEICQSIDPTMLDEMTRNINKYLSVGGCLIHTQAVKSKNLNSCKVIVEEFVQIDCFKQVIDDDVDEICRQYAQYGGSESLCNQYLTRHEQARKLNERSSFVFKLENNKLALISIALLLPLLGLLFLRNHKFESKLKLYLYCASYMAFFIMITGLLTVGWPAFGIASVFSFAGNILIHSLTRTNGFLQLPVSFIINGLIGGIFYALFLNKANNMKKLTKLKEFLVLPILSLIITLLILYKIALIKNPSF